MILPDIDIETHMRHRVIPWDAELVNPASMDLRLGNEWLDISGPEPVKIVSDDITLYPANITTSLFNMFSGKFHRRPTLLLATTLEMILLPPDMCAMVKLKTTPCREGLGHPIADWVDPGFQGHLTLMLHAFKPITLRAGQRVCQIVFEMMDKPSLCPYGVHGHYMGQLGPTMSWREKYKRVHQRIE